MEEAHDQLTITRKQIKRGKKHKVEEDVISLLPDCLLVEILSRLSSTEEAIRTGALSKRWQYLWTYVPTLSFRDPDNFLETEGVLWKMPWEPDYHQQQFFYINSCFTYLRLSYCKVNPTGPICWKNLKTWTISFMKLDEDLIQNILSGTPLLETWSLECCYGYRRLDITSKSVKNLVVYGYAAPRIEDVTPFIIEINAPYILSLAIKDHLSLWKLLLLNMSSLIKANLDYSKGMYYSYETMDKEEEEEMLKGLILNLRHVKELEIGSFCSEVLSRLEAEGFVLPSNLKVPEDDSSELSDYDSAESED